jgi:hypothetical protein
MEIIENESGEYIGMADYLCLSSLIGDYKEIRFATRNKIPD